MGCVWSMEKDGTWQSEPKILETSEQRYSINGDPLDNKVLALWAPEIHYIKSVKNWFLVASLNDSANGKGSFVLESVSGKPEGPYRNIEGNKNGAIFPKIDGTLFEDEDGTVYFVGLNDQIAKMKPDMSDLAEPFRTIVEQKFNPEPPVEGAFIFKHGGKYHLAQAVWSHRAEGGDTYIIDKDKPDTRYSYDCLIASSDNIYGPYTRRYNACTGAGHNNLFKDKEGNWWATQFFNPRGNQALEFGQTCRPALVPMKFVSERFAPDKKRLRELLKIGF
ncbi:MAG: family 43 glycosylhydrolase [Rikenellaceae bacterium]